MFLLKDEEMKEPLALVSIITWLYLIQICLFVYLKSKL
jgi:hypothetical protein